MGELIRHPKKAISDAQQLRKAARRHGETSEENIEARRDAVSKAIIRQTERLNQIKDANQLTIAKMQQAMHAQQDEEKKASMASTIEDAISAAQNIELGVEAGIAMLEALSLTTDCLSFRYDDRDETTGKRQTFRQPITRMLSFLHNEMVANRCVTMLAYAPQLLKSGAIKPEWVESAKRELGEYFDSFVDDEKETANDH